MANKAPGKAHREGITLVQLMDMFPDEATATEWFEKVVWNGTRGCGHCGSTCTSEVPNAKPMPYWCSDCRSYFSVRTGTAIAHSRTTLRKWVIAIYLELTSLKSISSMKLHRDIGVTQKTAWFMLHRIREAWKAKSGGPQFSGPVEVDETYMGGKRANMSNAKRKELAQTVSKVGTARSQRPQSPSERLRWRILLPFALADSDSKRIRISDDGAHQRLGAPLTG